MDVAGAGIERLEQDEIDDLDDRRLLRLTCDVAHVYGRGVAVGDTENLELRGRIHSGEQRTERRLPGVEPSDRVANFAARCDRRADCQARRELERLNRFAVEGIRHCDHEDSVLDTDGDDAEALRYRLFDQLHFRAAEGHLMQVEARYLELPRDRLCHVALGQSAARNDRIDRRHVLRCHALLDSRDLRRVEASAPLEEIQEPLIRIRRGGHMVGVWLSRHRVTSRHRVVGGRWFARAGKSLGESITDRRLSKRHALGRVMLARKSTT